MKYQVFVSGAPRVDPQQKPEDRPGLSGDGFACATKQGVHTGGSANGHHGDPEHAARVGASMGRHFPPVIQFLTDVDPLVEQQLQSLCIRLYRQGRPLPDVCQEIYLYARSLGFDLALAVQEVASTNMPSFPGQTVYSALLMADIRRIPAPQGYHDGRVAA